MRISYGVIAIAEVPANISGSLVHIEDLEGYEVRYLSWRENNREQGFKRCIWVPETAESEIKRFKNLWTAKSYLENIEPILAENKAYATEIELEEFVKK